MHIELSEILICPACGPDANLVLAVDEAEGRWVRSGTLACARCDRRYPVGSGLVDFTAARDRGDGGGGTVDAGEPADSPGAGSEDLESLATEVAALLELGRRAGAVVLGPGLAPVAPRLAALAERAEILALAPGPAGEPNDSPAEGDTGGRFTRLVTAGAGALPVRERRLAGLALWSPDRAGLEEAVPALGPGGRLVGLRPGADIRRALDDLDLDVLASEARAFVASRPA